MFYNSINHHINPTNNNIAIYDSELNAFSYAQLHQKITEIETVFKQNNLTKSSLVILHFDKSFEGLAHLLCCIKMEIIYIPVDANTPENRLEKIKKSSNANAIVSNQFSIQHLNKEKQNLPNNACCVLYTSGSTGNPKGVIISQKSLASFTEWCSTEFNITSTDTLTNYAPFHFDLSTFDIFSGLCNGAKIWLINNTLAGNFRLLGEQLKKIKPSVWYATPTVYKLLMQYGNLNADYQPRLSLFAGEIFDVKSLNQLRKTWNNTTFYNLYGPTETNVCTFYKLPSSDEPLTQMQPIGISCPYAKTKLSDKNELLIAGESLMLGYLNEPNLTAEKFTTINDEKWLKSGDIVEIIDNLMYYRSRNDRMIKKNGFRIELAEIENEMLNHPNIKQVACIFNQQKITVLYIGNKTSNIALKTFCKQQLLAYMIPDSFIFLNELPVNSNGKIDYAQLIQYL